jgi:hypothetical protein
MVLGMPYTAGIKGRLESGPVADRLVDLPLAGVRGVFFTGIATLKLRAFRFVKKKPRAES